MEEKNKETKEKNKPETPAFSSKEVGKAAGKAERKIRMNDRMNLEITQDSGHYKKGQLISPHRVYGEAMVNSGIAKEVK